MALSIRVEGMCRLCGKENGDSDKTDNCGHQVGSAV